MQRKRSIAVFFAALLATFSLVVYSTVARAEGGNTLTVGVADETYLPDITSKEALVADVYKVAEAERDDVNDTYTYTMIGTFAGLQSQLDAAQAGTGDWALLYDAAAAASKNATPLVKGHVIAGSGAGSIQLAEDGMYLVLAHGTGEATGTNVAHGTDYDYTFQPTLVAMPTKYDKNGQMSGLIRTDEDYGEWHREATINLKFSMEPVTPPEPTPDNPPKKEVDTGDQNHLLPLYVIMAVSGTLFVVLAVKSIRERREQDGQ